MLRGAHRPGAACERSLAEARAALADALPAAAPVAFDAPRAHRYTDAHSGRTLEPLMFVRIDAPKAQWGRLADDLRSRGARLHEVEMQAHRVVLRAQAPLARLLGLADRVHAATGGAAAVRMSLVRYV